MWEACEEMDRLFPWQRQLCECERLICQREAVLSERTRHAESLARTLEEYRTTTQADPSSPLGTYHHKLAPGSSRESCHIVPEMHQALMPVVRDLVPVERSRTQHCLHPQHSPGIRCAL